MVWFDIKKIDGYNIECVIDKATDKVVYYTYKDWSFFNENDTIRISCDDNNEFIDIPKDVFKKLVELLVE